MTLQDLLSTKQTKTSDTDLEVKKAKTAALIASNKAAAATVLQGALKAIERNSPTYTEKTKQLWI